MGLGKWVAVFVMSLLCVGGGACADPAPLDEPLLAEFGRSELTIETTGGARHALRVYVATTPDQWAQGLMMVRTLPDDVGMLFIYPEDKRGSMWMKNTLLPLDILFVRRDGTIANIARDTTPRSLKSIRSDGAIRGALELKGGTAKALGIKSGDRVLHAAFRFDPAE